MAAKPSVKLTYTMPYRGATQQWTNRFHFDGHVPASDAEWEDFFTQLRTWGPAIIGSDGHLVGLTGYLAGSDVPVYSWTGSLAGTATFNASDVPTPGDVAALVRCTTTQRSTKNHPIYLFKYFHQAKSLPTNADQISTNLKTTLDSYMTHWISGAFTIAGVPVKYCGPNGAVAQTRLTETYLTHRDFRR